VRSVTVLLPEARTLEGRARRTSTAVRPEPERSAVAWLSSPSLPLPPCRRECTPHRTIRGGYWSVVADGRVNTAELLHARYALILDNSIPAGSGAR
jgi:hypothetical protein